MGDPFDVIPFDVRVPLPSLYYLLTQPRISKAAGQSWVQVPLVTYTRVRETANILCDVSYPTVGSYLGIEVAIKEVLPSTEYDVAKYFEREWRLLKFVPLPHRLCQT
jgi:hypothetical protein